MKALILAVLLFPAVSFAEVEGSSVTVRGGKQPVAKEFSDPSISISFQGKEIVKIVSDGTVLMHPGYTPSSAARAFWAALVEQNPWILAYNRQKLENDFLRSVVFRALTAENSEKSVEILKELVVSEKQEDGKP